MSSPYYKRRRPSLIRNFWIYRRLVALAIVLGLVLWFVAINSTEVTVFFPFRLGKVTSTSGLLLLLGAGVGSVVTALAMTLILAIRRRRPPSAQTVRDARSELPDDRPPP